MSSFIWSFQANLFSGPLKVRDINIWLYQECISFPPVITPWWVFLWKSLMPSQWQGCLPAQLPHWWPLEYRDMVLVKMCPNPDESKVTHHLRNCNLPYNCSFICCCCNHIKGYELVVCCSLAFLDWLSSRLQCSRVQAWHVSYKSLGCALRGTVDSLDIPSKYR